jgi:hypothetical protein
MASGSARREIKHALLLEFAMDEKHRLSGFKALLASHKTNDFYLEERDGGFQLWRDLSAEARLEYIVKDAAFYDVPFEQFAEAVRESVDHAAIEEAALRLAMRSGRELYDLKALFPDDGRTEPPPLVERVSELLNSEILEHEMEGALSVEKLAALFQEMREDESAGKHKDAHRYGKESFQKILDGKAETPAPEKGKDKGIER